MNAYATQTRSQTDSFTDARLRVVMAEVGADFYAPAAAGLITADTARKWAEELSFILLHRAANSYFPGRGGDVFAVLKPGYIRDFANLGARG